MTRTTGTATWLHFGTTDMAGAKAFYSGLFGWEFEDSGPETHHYQMITKDGALVGGGMDTTGIPGPDGGALPSRWDTFLAVDDVDARVEKAQDAGGTLLMPVAAAGSAGGYGMVQDPTGSVVGLWQGCGIEGYEFTGKPGSPVWFELMTHGFDEASSFYSAVVDADLRPMSEPMEDDSFRYVTNGPGESASWGLGDATGVMPPEAAGWRVYFGVNSSDAAIATVLELGGQVLDGPVDSPFGRIATIAAPDGATFQICAMSEAVPEG